MTKDQIISKYKIHILENGQQPASIYSLAKALKTTEKAIYEHFNSFQQMESEVWKDTFKKTIENIRQEEVYATYSVREKMLSFYFAWIETLKEDRSFILLSISKWSRPIAMKKNPVLAESAIFFKDYMNELLMEGRETREIEQRPIPQLMNKYPDMLWMQTLTILEFWSNDYSKAFEKTDTLIEKYVNTSLDWMGRSPLDSLFDLGKFLYQNKK
ncbi:MAG: TetR family transcriptional regulator C-terminal domain-containing protein [Spirosomataceae bacterium]